MECRLIEILSDLPASNSDSIIYLAKTFDYNVDVVVGVQKSLVTGNVFLLSVPQKYYQQILSTLKKSYRNAYEFTKQYIENVLQKIDIILRKY